MTVPPRCLGFEMEVSQFPEVSALGLGGFVFGNGDKLGAAVRGLGTGWGNWCFWWVSELVRVDWLSYSEWFAMVWSCSFLSCGDFFLLLGGVGIFIKFFFPLQNQWFNLNSEGRLMWQDSAKGHFFDQLKGTCKVLRDLPTFHSWRFKVTFLGWWKRDPFKGLSDLQLGDGKGTLNHLVGIIFPLWELGFPQFFCGWNEMLSTYCPKFVRNFSTPKKTFTRWFNVTFWSSSWRSRNNLKGSLILTKKVTFESPGGYLVYIGGWNTTQLYRDYVILSHF